LFNSKVIAEVRNVSVALLERERWQRTGPHYIRLNGRVLYRKSDILDWIRSQERAWAREKMSRSAYSTSEEAAGGQL
jgi:hypothetical protein